MGEHVKKRERTVLCETCGELFAPQGIHQHRATAHGEGRATLRRNPTRRFPFKPEPPAVPPEKPERNPRSRSDSSPSKRVRKSSSSTAENSSTATRKLLDDLI